jgi:cellulose synthase/poly-beta-1,6-N-acetylglucosamine synthase-like glycosyltransferase
MPFFEFALHIMAWLVCVPLSLLLGVFSIEVLAGLKPQRHVAMAACQPVTVIVMPAHNEAQGLAACLATLKSVVPDDVRVLVVADNCTDATAEIARTSGVHVIERHDPHNRGKGHALAFARDHLMGSPPECVIVLDADCVPLGNTIDALRSAVEFHGTPVQSTNLLRSDLTVKPMVQISNFAFVVKNLIRQRGAGRIGHVAILGGTGMAMPWSFFAAAPLASSDIVEDLSLGIYAVRTGQAPQFHEAARVESAAAEGAGALTQRTRWEHGFLATASQRAIPLLIEGVRTGSLSRFWMGCHLSVPPLAMLCSLSAFGLVILTALGLITKAFLPAIILATLLSLSLSLVLIVWFREGRRYLAGSAVLRMPLYLLWKLPIYLRLAGRRQSEWTRTKRSGE